MKRLRTKYGVSSARVASKVEHMGMVSGHDSQGVVDAGQEIGQTDGSVHFHGLIQGLLGFSLVVSVVDAST